ncbi:MAG: CPBP family intramembrane metalloprotease [Candidatus Omnitrophica bacterium]|nr:CPBP family intramembrane metalloprotease [Candidatus Omnitrophota bacterium]
MNKFIIFIKKERLYILLLIFIILLNVLMAVSGDVKVKGEQNRAKEAQEEVLQREKMEEVLRDNRFLALLFSLASLLILAVLFLGIVIDAMLIGFRLGGNRLEMATREPGPVRWNVWDVAKVVILFLFFGYMIIMIESLLLGTYPSLKDDNFRMILNSSILDVMAVVFILYFTVGQYKENILSLGLTFKNFFKNVFYGITGYIAAVPALIGTLVVIIFIINITKYVPEKQAVVEMFMKEKNTAFLIYSGIFTSLIGPLIEELFFRGFMYSAFKKYIGIFWAMLFTSVVFAVLHTNVVGFVPIVILGMLLAYLYEKTGSLVSSVTVHVIHNLSMVFFVFLLKQVRV